MRWVFGFFLAASLTAQTFDPLADRFFEEAYFRFHPSDGTASGFHRYDTRLEDFSAGAVREEIAALRRYLPRFEKQPAQPDRDLVITKIRARLLELEQIRMWERDPDRYSSGLTSSVFGIMSRKFAPAADRLRSVIARERQAPAVFAAARANLKNPPRIYTEVAIEQMPGIVSFFEKDVPEAFREVKDPQLLGEFATENARVIEELRRYGAWLSGDMLPRSKGDFRIGPDLYRKKLLYDEMVDTPLDQLLALGYRDLRRNQEELKRVAARIDSRRPAREVFGEAERDYPAPDRLLGAFRDSLDGLRRFITEKKILTIPSPVPPVVQETPPFARALTFASMDTPGPYETVATEAFFNVTLPDPAWTPQMVREHMAGFNRGVILSTAIHEAYPGHYTQFLWVQKAPSKVRKLLGCGSNAEGWAHYTEQMMLEEGYGGGDPKIKLGQLQDALLRNARFIAGLEMHTGRMTFEQAVEFFVNEGYQSRTNGQRETKRGTADPTYLIYTLGKLQIYALRAEVQKKEGAAFSLARFHDTFLAQGYPPVKLVRKAYGLN